MPRTSRPDADNNPLTTSGPNLEHGFPEDFSDDDSSLDDLSDEEQEAQMPLGLETDEDESFEEDFIGIQAGFALIPEGMHQAKVIDLTKNASKAGNPQFEWEFKITSGDAIGQTMRHWTSLLPQARWKVVETLEALNIAASDRILRFKKSQVIGKTCALEVFHDEYNGKLQHKVKMVHPSGSLEDLFTNAR